MISAFGSFLAFSSTTPVGCGSGNAGMAVEPASLPHPETSLETIANVIIKFFMMLSFVVLMPLTC
jgi:hypothetical protein